MRKGLRVKMSLTSCDFSFLLSLSRHVASALVLACTRLSSPSAASRRSLPRCLDLLSFVFDVWLPFGLMYEHLLHWCECMRYQTMECI
jgi:hypothetical protein